jgi:hypothetical protein
MADYRMIGSAGSLDALNALVKKMWGWETVIFTPISDNEWSVSSFKGVVDALRVVKKGRRFRFEQRLPEAGHVGGRDSGRFEAFSARGISIGKHRSFENAKDAAATASAEDDGALYYVTDNYIDLEHYRSNVIWRSDDPHREPRDPEESGHAAGSVAIRRAPVSQADFFAVKIANRLVSDYGVPEQKALHLVQRMEPAVRRAYERGQSVDRTTRELLGE